MLPQVSSAATPDSGVADTVNTVVGDAGTVVGGWDALVNLFTGKGSSSTPTSSSLPTTGAVVAPASTSPATLLLVGLGVVALVLFLRRR